jgi:hypothetical protein
MALNYLLFVVYLIIFCWLLFRVPFIKNTGISSKVLLGLFLFKILAGIAIGWIAIHIYGPGNDYWDIHDEAWKEYQLLLTSPGRYLTNIFTSDYRDGYAGIFNSFNSYWNDLEGNIIIKLVSIFNIFSRGDYYINSLFFNFLVFFGHITLYRLFIKIYPGRKIPVIIGCFLLPSTIYFSSGIHKDGIVFLMLAILIFSVYQSIFKNRFTLKRMLLIGTSLVLLFLIRNFIFLMLVPALFAWIFSVKAKLPAGRTFAAVYLLTGFLIFNISSLFNKVQPLEIITKKQSAYINLPVAATQIKLTPLQPGFKSFVNNAPEALNHSLLRPYLWEIPVKSLLPLSIELLFSQLLILLFIFFRRKDLNPADKPFLFFAMFFTFSVFLLIGYIVPNLGTLVRYRSLYLPLMVTPILCQLDWNKVAILLKIKK